VGVRADEKPAKGKGTPKAMLEQLRNLLPHDPDDKLKMTDDEKTQIAKFQTEFEDKAKDSLAAVKDEFLKARDAIKQARENKDKEAFKKAMEPVREKMEDVLKIRKDYETKVRDLLTDDQRKAFDDLRSSSPLQGKGKKKLADDSKPQATTEEPKKDDKP
jgi:hypothetical protein